MVQSGALYLECFKRGLFHFSKVQINKYLQTLLENSVINTSELIAASFLRGSKQSDQQITIL